MPWGTLLLALACTASEPVDTCGVETTIPGWTPGCEATLSLYEDDALLLVDDRLEAWLPRPLEDTSYGGQTGNDLTLLFDGELATSRISLVTLADEQTTVRIDATFSAGTVSGVVFPRVEDVR
ncbi:MAG: hypothetical protein GY913_27965 [Proteobacteria bacterium]|nr:hypothetical protein [Pseudomonadota bacterium]MCP4920747.1 hypothetical protein [Pseudomonadota bacterium]